MSTASLLRTWRERALLTQEQLAERAGLSARTVRRLESDDTMRPHSNTLRQLATALDLSAAEWAALAAESSAGPAAGAGSSDPGAPSSGTAAVVPRQLPAPPTVFTGRATELAEVDQLLGSAAVVITAIDGMAGIGKTALAVNAGHRSASHFPDGQIFLDLHGHTEGTRPVEPADALQRILSALGVPGERIPQHLEDRAALYRTRLADRKMLILLDNAASEDQVMPLLPGTPGSLVLVTSRRMLTGLDHSHTVSLDVLPPDDAVRLLTRTAGEHRLDDEPSDVLGEIVELCGRLPLAIRIAAARLRTHPTWTGAHLAGRLRDHRRRLAVLETGQSSVRAALDLSYRQLTPHQQRAYRLLGLFPGVDFDAYAAAALTDTTLPRVGRLLDDLLDVNLVQEPVRGRYRFHDLVGAHAASATNSDDTESDRRAALIRLLDHYGHTASAAMDVAYPYERDRRPRVPPSDTPAPPMPDAGTAATWLDGELPNLLTAARYAAENGRPDHVHQLSSTLHRYLRDRAHYGDAETLHDHALAATRSAGNRSGELDALLCRGSIRRLRGSTEQAAADFTHVLAIARATGNSTAELRASSGLGDVHITRGRYEQAAEHYAAARKIAIRVDDRGSELEASAGLGAVHLIRGEPAIDEFERVLDIARATGHGMAAQNALRGLGHAYRMQREYERAAACYQQVLDMSHVSGNRQGQLSAMIGLGHAHRAQGSHEQAISSYQQALRLAKEIDYRNFQFEALHGLGRLHSAAGRPDQALTHHRQALDLATDLDQPTDQARTHDGIAHAHDALGHRHDARRHWRRALDVLASLGVDHTEDEGVTTSAIRAHLERVDHLSEPRVDLSSPDH